MLKSILQYFSVNTVCAGMGLLCVPILLAQYGPTQIGIWGVTFTTLMSVNAISALRIEMATVRGRSRSIRLLTSKSALALSLCINISFALVGYSILASAGYLAFSLFGIMSIVSLAAALSINLVGVQWLLAEKHFGLMSIFEGSRFVGVPASQVLCFLASPEIDLLEASLMGSLSQLALYGAVLRGTGFTRLRSGNVSITRLKRVYASNQGLATRSTAGIFINSVSQVIPLYAVTFVFGAQISGYLYSALRILGGVVQTLGNGLRHYYFAEFSQKAGNSAEQKALYGKSLIVGGILGGLAYGAVLAAMTLGYSFFPNSLQEDLLSFCLILTIGFAIRLIFFVGSNLSIVTQREEVSLMWQVCNFGLSSMLALSAPFWASAAAFIMAYSIQMALSYILLGVLFHVMILNGDKA